MALVDLDRAGEVDVEAMEQIWSRTMGYESYPNTLRPYENETTTMPLSRLTIETQSIMAAVDAVYETSTRQHP